MQMRLIVQINKIVRANFFIFLLSLSLCVGRQIAEYRSMLMAISVQAETATVVAGEINEKFKENKFLNK